MAWVLAAALQLQQVALWDRGVYMAFVALAPVLIGVSTIKKLAYGVRCVSWVVALGLLAFGSVGLRASVFLDAGLAPILEGQDVAVRGVVASLPQRNESALRFRLQVETAQVTGRAVALPELVDVAWYTGTSFGKTPLVADTLPTLPDVRAGERWDLTLRVKAPHGSRNPHGFDYELWLWGQGVQATGYVRTTAKDLAPQRLEQTWRYPVSWARQAVREAIYREVDDRQRAGLLAALVVGDQAAIDRADWDVFRATGVAHLVSISGLHITMFAWGAALCIGWLWRRSGRLCLAAPAPHAALVGGVLLACAYSGFSGWGVPAQRTCLMLATVGLLRLSGARWPWPMVWAFACAVVVALDPWALLQAGFWLSFVAVGVLFASGSEVLRHTAAADAVPISAAIRTGRTGIWQAARATIARAATTLRAESRQQWLITLALAPLTLLLFGQVSVVGLLANVLAIPWVTLVVTPLAMLGVVLPGLWSVASVAVGLLLAVLQWFAEWPWASLSLAIAPLWVGALAVVGGLVVVMPWPWSMRLLGLPLVLPLVLWRATLPPQGEFELLAADIGQGNAVLVRTANHALLYDAGPRYSQDSDAGHRVLVPLLQALQTRLDVLMLSHRDMDHVGGAAAILAMQPQAQLMSSIEADNAVQRIRPATRCVAGQRWQWDGVGFEVLHPLAQDYAGAAKPNALSCVLRISNGTRSALLVGDIEHDQEARLVRDAAVADAVVLKADVLLVPHHGSKTSSSAAFLAAVAPTVGVVQAGYRNRFGHPAPGVQARYRDHGVQLVDSPHCGAYTWQSWKPDAPLADVCFRIHALRYWHHRVP